MWASRVFSFLFLVAFAPSLASAEVRTWTDARGQTMEGELLEVTADDKAVIRSNGTKFTIPITRFSATDRAYIQAHQDADSDEAARPDPDAGKPQRTRAPRRRDLFDMREWTDSEGNSIRARYVRVHEGQIVLMQGNRGVPVPFEKLSEEDQSFLRTHLEARGEGDLIPPVITTPLSTEGGEAGSPGRPGRNFPPPSFPAPAGSPGSSGSATPAYRPEPSQPANSPEGDQLAGVEAGSLRFPPPIFPEPKEPAGDSRSPSPPEGIAEPSLQHRPALPNSRPSFAQEERTPRVELTYYCEGCKKSVPSTLKAGDSCPHCGVFFSAQKDEHGRVVGQASVPWYRSGINLGILFAIIGIIAKAVMGRSK